MYVLPSANHVYPLAIHAVCAHKTLPTDTIIIAHDQKPPITP
jgi:hypothetical protein